MGSAISWLARGPDPCQAYHGTDIDGKHAHAWQVHGEQRCAGSWAAQPPAVTASPAMQPTEYATSSEAATCACMCVRHMPSVALAVTIHSHRAHARHLMGGTWVHDPLAINRQHASCMLLSSRPLSTCTSNAHVTASQSVWDDTLWHYLTEAQTPVPDTSKLASTQRRLIAAL